MAEIKFTAKQVRTITAAKDAQITSLQSEVKALREKLEQHESVTIVLKHSFYNTRLLEEGVRILMRCNQPFDAIMWDYAARSGRHFDKLIFRSDSKGLLDRRQTPKEVSPTVNWYCIWLLTYLFIVGRLERRQRRDSRFHRLRGGTARPTRVRTLAKVS